MSIRLEVLQKAVESCEAITIPNGYNHTIKKVDWGYKSPHDVHESLCPYIGIVVFDIVPPEPPMVHSFKRGKKLVMIVRGILKQYPSWQEIVTLGEDIEAAFFEDPSMGLEHGLDVIWQGTTHHPFLDYSWVDVRMSITWRESK